LNASGKRELGSGKWALALALQSYWHQKGSTMNEESLNVLGTPLVPCSYDPLTGYFRDGCCNTDENDQGSHVVCAKVTQAFLDFSLQQGNDLVTPRPEHRFRGLKAGDRWCLCALRWKQAYMAGVAPKVVLESTHLRALDFVTLEQLKS
jgi:uncharacterized protein (DUF2237 family)